jgi:hypothetical protein
VVAPLLGAAVLFGGGGCPSWAASGTAQ